MLFCKNGGIGSRYDCGSCDCSPRRESLISFGKVPDYVLFLQNISDGYFRFLICKRKCNYSVKC